MNTLNFFRKGILALLVAATALVACSKDTDNLKPNTVTLKSAEKKITSAEYIVEGDGNYRLFLSLNNSDERVVLALNKDNHMNGTPIELSKDDTPKQGWRWAVEYYDSNDNRIIGTFGAPGAPHFIQGTLTISGTPGSGSVNISLKNGRVMGTNGEEYTLTLNYSGEMKDIAPQPDSSEIEKIKANILGKWNLEGTYFGKEKINKPKGWYLIFKSDGTLTRSDGQKETSSKWNVLSENGKMYVVLGEDKIELKKLEGNILELIFRKNTFNRYTKEIIPLPDPKPNTVTLNSAEKQITRAEYIDQGEDNYTLFLYLNNSDNERVKLYLNKDNHMKGNAIVLSQPETKHKGWHWAVLYNDPHNRIINASGDPSKHHFIQGTLTVSGTPGSGSVNISLKNGRVMGTNGEEYTLTLNYSGEMEKG